MFSWGKKRRRKRALEAILHGKSSTAEIQTYDMIFRPRIVE